MDTMNGLKSLQHILNCSIEILKIDLSEWSVIIKDVEEIVSDVSMGSELAVGMRAEKQDALWMIAAIEGDQLTVLKADRSALNEKEKDMLSWTLRHARKDPPHKSASRLSDSERLAVKLSEWLQEQLETDEPVYSLPDQLMVGSRLYHDMIPFLLITEHSSAKQDAYPELEKLLRSFLSEDILLIPLKSQEWLIWGPLSLLKDEEAEFFDHTEEETVEDSLASIALGLHEMLASEWLGECHLAVTHPVSPSKGMVETTITLRETINLGRKFHVGTNIHLPWMLQLERLLNAIPEANRSKYLEQSLKRADLFVEAEMLGTLETFFSLDCNVSETAKKLYIHRNTLLYRLDKLKQETGLDVRQFRDAVLVKIILLLYKVTKRN